MEESDNSGPGKEMAKTSKVNKYRRHEINREKGFSWLFLLKQKKERQKRVLLVVGA